jgi:hypothetical protein
MTGESKGVDEEFFREAILEAVLLLEDPVLLDERVDPVNHLLDELDLAVAEAVLVRDVVGDPGLTARLAACTCAKNMEELRGKKSGQMSSLNICLAGR